MKIHRLFSVGLAALTLLAAAVVVVPAHATPSADTAKTRATEAMNLMKTGDYAKFTDYMYPTVIQAMGGREACIAMSKSVMDQMNAGGIKITGVEIGTPGEPVGSGEKSFILVPLVLTLDTPAATVVNKSYLLGISTAGGEWQFIDGSTLTEEIAKQFVPDLPPTLKLPEKQAPTVTPKAQ